MTLANLLLCAALAVATTAASASRLAYDVDPKVLEVGTDRWMKELPDNLPLHAISIPATHDSLGTDHEFAHDSQGAKLETQLDLGIRAIDLFVRDTRTRFLPGPAGRLDLCLDAPGALTGDHHRLKLAACVPAYAAQRWTAL